MGLVRSVRIERQGKDIMQSGGKVEKLLKKKDIINHPYHYTFGKIEVIDVLEDWGLGFHLGNVVKYIARSSYKGKFLEDLKKARWYLDRKIELEERNDSNRKEKRISEEIS